MEEVLTIQTIKKFSFLPFILRNGRLVWTGSWFKTIEITETRTVDRVRIQGDGWSQDYITSSDWKIVKIA